MLELLVRAVAPSRSLESNVEHQNLALFTTFRPNNGRNDLDQQTLELAETAAKFGCGVDAQADADRSNALILPPKCIIASREPVGLERTGVKQIHRLLVTQIFGKLLAVSVPQNRTKCRHRFRTRQFKNKVELSVSTV